MTRIAIAFASAFVLALAATQISLPERGSGKIRCTVSATCPANKPVCVRGECEDPNDR